ncbi:MAG: rRNA pseudouridine synthase [Synergistes sp.]|nr:rRNA pseudouridine synthase [Synergistes sp.]
MTEAADKGIRLNRYIAMCGVAARRKAEEYIASGRIRINGLAVTEPGRQVLPDDTVEFDGRKIAPEAKKYLILNKPKGVLSAAEDARERTVIDILPPVYASYRLFPVGRLDRDSEGLIILTNDGDFSQQLIHPSNGFNKTYQVELRRPMEEPELIKWIAGVNMKSSFLSRYLCGGWEERRWDTGLK